MAKELIKQVWKAKIADQKLVTIPKGRTDIMEGDYVSIKKVEQDE